MLNGRLVEYMYTFDKPKPRGDSLFKLNLYDCDTVSSMAIWNTISGFESNKVIVYVYDMIYYKKSNEKKCMATYKIYIFKTALNSVNFLYIKSIFDIITFTNRENIFTLVRASLSETQP